MRNLILPLVLQLCGIIIIIAEFLVPSAGLLAVLSAGLIVTSIVLVFTNVSAQVGAAFIIADIIILPVIVILGLKLIARSPLSLRKTLSSSEGVSSQTEDMEKLMGKEGMAASFLRPAGIAVIEGKRIDVVSRGEFIEKNSAVTVISVTGNQVVVKKNDV